MLEDAEVAEILNEISSKIVRKRYFYSSDSSTFV
jgi:hypothetical protein